MSETTVPITAKLARHCLALDYDSLPSSAVFLAKQCILDWLGVTLAGAEEPLTVMLRDAAIEDVKFVRGDEKLRPFTDTLRSAKFGAVFPDDTPTKLVRRGILSCGKDTGCSFVLMTPDSVTSVN